MEKIVPTRHVRYNENNMYTLLNWGWAACCVYNI